MKNRLWRIIIGAIFFIVAIVINTNIEWLNIALYLISYIIVGGDIVKRAVRKVKSFFVCKFLGSKFKQLMLH